MLLWSAGQPANDAARFVQALIARQYQDPVCGLVTSAVHFVQASTTLGGWMVPLLGVFLRPRLPRAWVMVAALL